MNNKTKRQLRAEAVERLEILNHPSSCQIVDAITGNKWMCSNARRNALIDLLTDDEPQDEPDTREKLEEDCEKLIGNIQRRVFSGRDAGALRWQLKELLDRQAAITERYWMEINGANTSANIELNRQRAELQALLDVLEEENRLMRERLRNIADNDVTVFGMKLDEVRGVQAENTELRAKLDAIREVTA